MATTNTKPLKIGLVLDVSLDPPDGVQQYVVTIGEWLRSQGHDVHYLVGETKRHDLPNIHSLSRNVKVHFNGNSTAIPLPTSRKLLRSLLADEKFDVLHVQMPHNPFLAQRLILAADKRTAVIGTFHIAPANGLVSLATRALGIWLRPSIKRTDTLLSVSTAAADFAKQTYKVTTRVLPNVINYELFHDAQPFPEYSDDRLTLLFLGRLVPRKGCKLLLQAVKLLTEQDDIPKFRVLICGKGPLMQEMQDYAHSNNLNDYVTFTGFVSEEDKPRYYASADISIFPSTGGESFGIVLLEAMASGKAAALAGDNPGYRTVMAPQPELLFNPKNPVEFVNKLAAYMKDDKLRKAAESWGAEYTRQFAVDLVGEQLLEIYRQALLRRAKM